MTDYDAIVQIITSAIMHAKTEDPAAPHGTTWPEHTMGAEEASHYARAALHKLEKEGYSVVEKQPDPKAKKVTSSAARHRRDMKPKK